MRKSMQSLRVASMLLALMSLLIAAGCVSAPPDGNAGSNTGGTNGANKSGRVQIGFLMDTLKEERWQRDKALFEARAKELGADVFTQVANGNDAEQLRQAENLLTRGVSVLVVIPHGGIVASSIVEAAKKQNVPVISYDRLIENSDVDLYVSYQVVKIGELQAKYLLDRAPKGNYVLIGGAPTDPNAKLLHDGQMNVLKPAQQRGDIKIVADQPSREWKAEEALKNMENALTQNNDQVVAVVASNDGTAGGVVQALDARKLTGKVIVSGQDAELAACQRIVAGTQTMTIYKPIKPLAEAAADAAIKLARREKIETHDTVNNGKKDVPAILLEPIAVDKTNIASTIIKDGYQQLEAVYKDVPRDQWPKPDAAAAQSSATPGSNP